MSYDFLLSVVDGWVNISSIAATDYVKRNMLQQKQIGDYLTYYKDDKPVVRTKGGNVWQVYQNKNDLDLTGNTINLVRDIGSLRQTIRQGLGVDKGEWFADINYGIPYIEKVLSVKNSKGVLDSYILAFLKSFPEITGINYYKSTIVDRYATIVFDVSTIYNEGLKETLEFR